MSWFGFSITCALFYAARHFASERHCLCEAAVSTVPSAGHLSPASCSWAVSPEIGSVWRSPPDPCGQNWPVLTAAPPVLYLKGEKRRREAKNKLEAQTIMWGSKNSVFFISFETTVNVITWLTVKTNVWLHETIAWCMFICSDRDYLQSVSSAFLSPPSVHGSQTLCWRKPARPRWSIAAPEPFLWTLKAKIHFICQPGRELIL